MKDINYLIQNGIDVNKSLELFGDIKTYNDTLDEFVVSMKEKLNKLEEYKNSKDLGNYSIYVHALKADSKYFGFNALADIAYEHELKSKSGDILYITENFGVLQNKVNESILVASTYLNGEDTALSNNNTMAVNTNALVYTNPTILVVDDSNLVRNFVQKIFDGMYEVGTAKNGQEAIDLIATNLNNNKIVAILLDLNMPVVDGFAVLDYMKQNNIFKNIPVSIISGDSSRETIEKAFKYPIIDMLGKPFTDQDVKRIVDKTITFNDLI